MLEPDASGPGNWVGCPTVLHDPARESLLMTYRRRRPRGGPPPDRGHECVVAESSDGIHFEELWSVTKDAFESTSMERSCLHRDPSGRYLLYCQLRALGGRPLADRCPRSGLAGRIRSRSCAHRAQACGHRHGRGQGPVCPPCRPGLLPLREHVPHRGWACPDGARSQPGRAPVPLGRRDAPRGGELGPLPGAALVCDQARAAIRRPVRRRRRTGEGHGGATRRRPLVRPRALAAGLGRRPLACLAARDRLAPVSRRGRARRRPPPLLRVRARGRLS